MKLKEVKQDIQDMFYLLAMQGLNYIAPLLVLPYLMKVLGAEKFGYIGFSLSVMQYLMLIVDFGFNLSATKRIALIKDNKEELNKIFSATLYAKFGLLAISFLILMFVVLVPRFAIYRETMLVMFLMVIGNAFSFVWLFQGVGKIRLISIFNMVAKLSILPLTFVFVKSSSDYIVAGFIQSMVVLVSTLITIGFIVRYKMVSVVGFDKKQVFLETKESYPLFLSSAATSIYLASFVILLGYFSTSDQVGQYSAADRIMRAFVMLILMPMLQVFYPKISRLGIEKREYAIRFVKILFFFVIFCMSMVFVVLFFLSPYFVCFLGKDYQQALPLFKIMAFVPLFVGMSGVVGQLGLLALGNEKDKKNYQRVYFIAGIIAIICVLFGVWLYEAKGAALALLITEVSVFVLMLWYARKYLIKK